jgi:hypothetical protein
MSAAPAARIAFGLGPGNHAADVASCPDASGHRLAIVEG